MIPRFVAPLFALVLLVASCGSSAPATLPSDVQVTVDMKEYTVVLTPATFKAGTIKFGVRNLGAMVHQFDLIKTDLPADKLPIDPATAKAKEDGLVKQILNLQPGKAATTTADLAPGHYAIICNTPGHYQLLMRADFTVE